MLSFVHAVRLVDVQAFCESRKTFMVAELRYTQGFQESPCDTIARGQDPDPRRVREWALQGLWILLCGIRLRRAAHL